MLIVQPGHKLSAYDVKRQARDPDGKYLIHRGAGEHESSTECWCCPMVVTGASAYLRPARDLQIDLNAHFAVH